MIWTAWRQQRSLVVAMSIVAIVFLTYVLFTGVQEQSLWSHFLGKACKGILSSKTHSHCTQVNQAIIDASPFNRFIAIAGIVMAPLFGSILGVSAVAHEVEHRTIRLDWTQSGSRSQWLFSKYVVNVAILLTIFVPMCLILAWWNGAAHYSARIGPSGFPIAGFMLVLNGFVAFTVVVALGLFIRRAGWTLASGLVAMGILVIAVEVGIRPRLVSPEFTVVSTSQVTEGSSSGFYSSGGVPANSWGRGGGYVPTGTKVTPSAQTLNFYSSKFGGCLNSPLGSKREVTHTASRS